MGRKECKLCTHWEPSADRGGCAPVHDVTDSDDSCGSFEPLDWPCPGIVVEPVVASGCGGGHDCPTCRGDRLRAEGARAMWDDALTTATPAEPVQCQECGGKLQSLGRQCNRCGAIWCNAAEMDARGTPAEPVCRRAYVSATGTTAQHVCLHGCGQESEPVSCSSCGGTGDEPYGGNGHVVPCCNCSGSGEVLARKCGPVCAEVEVVEAVRELYEAAHDVCLARDWDMGHEADGHPCQPDGVRLGKAVARLRGGAIGSLTPAATVRAEARRSALNQAAAYIRSAGTLPCNELAALVRALPDTDEENQP